MTGTDKDSAVAQEASLHNQADSGAAGIDRKSGLFRNRAFATLWGGSVASSIGSSAGSLAIIWLVYAETGSAFDIALVGIFGLVPRIAFGVISGALADRHDRLGLMLMADSVRAFTLIAFAVSLAFIGFNLFALLAVVFILGIGQSIFRPAINSFPPVAVEKDQLANANGLFSVAQEVTSIIGSPLGGILIAIFGVGLTLMFNGAGYVVSAMFIAVVAMSLSTVKKDQKEQTEARQPFLDQVKGGIAETAAMMGVMDGAMVGGRGRGFGEGMVDGMMFGGMAGGGLGMMGGGGGAKRSANLNANYNYPVVAVKGLSEYQPAGYEFNLTERVTFDSSKVPKSIKLLNGDIGEDAARASAKTNVEQIQSHKAHKTHHSIQSITTESDVSDPEILHVPVWYARFDRKGKKEVLVIDGHTGNIINSIGIE